MFQSHADSITSTYLNFNSIEDSGGNDSFNPTLIRSRQPTYKTNNEKLLISRFNPTLIRSRQPTHRSIGLLWSNHD